MKKQKIVSYDSSILRKKAEELVNKNLSKITPQEVGTDSLKLYHELEIYQAELELQNSQLIHAISDAQDAIELYDFAPSGYYTLTKDFYIARLNLEGAKKLGKERSLLVNQRFDQFLSEDSKTIFQHFIENVFCSREKKTCEVCISSDVDSKIYVHLSAVVASNKEYCLITAVNITARKQLEKINLARLHLLQYSDNHTLSDLLEETLNQAEDLTGSRIGFYHFVEADQRTLHLQNWSTQTKRDFCRADGKGTHYDINKAGVWADCVREGRPIIHNDYSTLPNKKGLPPGHAIVNRELVVPVLRGGKIVAILGVGNKPANYNEKDIELVALLADLAWDITGRKKAEEALQIEMQNFYAVFESSPVAMIVIDKTTNIVLANLAAIALSGGNEEDFIQHQPGNALRCIHSSKDPRGCGYSSECRLCKFRNYISDMIAQSGNMPGAEIEMELFRNEEKHRVWLSIGIEPLLLNGKTHWIITLNDITERKQIEKSLRENEEKFRIVADYTFDWEYWEDEDGKIVYMSPSCERISGYKVEDFIHDKLLLKRITHAGDVTIFNDHASKTHSRKHFRESSEIDFRIIKKDGSIAYISHLCRPIFTADGKYLGRRISNRDITKRKLSEYELRKKDALLSITGETAKVGGWEIDVETFKLTWTEEVYQIHEIDFQFDPTVKSGINFYTPDSRPILKNAVNRAIENGEAFDLELEFITIKGNHRWVHSIGKAYQEHGKTIKVYGSIQDVTESRNVRDLIKSKNEELIKLNSEKDKFFSIIAHDLRGPFNGFLGLTQIMEERLPTLTQEDLQMIITSLRNSATNLYGLLSNLLEWSRIQRGLTSFNPQSFLLKPKISEIITQLSESAAKKHITISQKIQEDIFVCADVYMLAGIIRNLVTNAIKFTPTGGKIEISAQAKPNKSVEFSVQDSGIGMSKTMIDDLFHLDINTSRKGTEGEASTGLGLLICKDLIEKHGGNLSIESEEGKGSNFHFSIPFNPQFQDS